MNWDMIGHEWAVQLLHEHITQDRLRHAYLFTGPRGVGRRTLALRLAQALNCTQPTSPGEPCRACRACTHTEKMQHPDLAIVKAEQEGGTLKVEQIRELQRSLALAPYEAHYRVALLIRFEEANANAANALLKTLEEPNPSVVLILTAESAESLLPTIASRCEVLRLRPLPVEAVSQGLQIRWGVPLEEARLLAHLSGGRPGYALRLHEEPEVLESRRGWLEDLQRLLGASRVERFAYAEALAKDKDKDFIRQLLQTWLSLWRDVLLCTAGTSTPPSNLDQQSLIAEIAAQLDVVAAQKAIRAVQRALEQFGANVNMRLALEVLLLDIPQINH